MNSNGDSASLWNIPLWTFASAKILPLAVNFTFQVFMFYYYCYYYYLPLPNFSTTLISFGFYWSADDWKSAHLSQSFLSILAGCSVTLIRTISILSQISISAIYFRCSHGLFWMRFFIVITVASILQYFSINSDNISSVFCLYWEHGVWRNARFDTRDHCSFLQLNLVFRPRMGVRFYFKVPEEFLVLTLLESF